jgi:hypothetical protein
MDYDAGGHVRCDHAAEEKTKAIMRFRKKLVYKLVPTTP